MNSDLPDFRIFPALEHREGRRIHWMKRSEWDRLKGRFGEKVLMDVEQTPLGEVASAASRVAALASESTKPEIAVYRPHESDDRYTAKKDLYRVVDDVRGRDDYEDLLRSASTYDSPALQEFFDDHVGLRPEEKGRDHWLTREETPSSVLSVFESTGSGSTL